MLESYLIRGLLIGLIFGVPAGAIGALTIQRTLNSGFTAGLMTGLGSSAADILYACVGVFGVTSATLLLRQPGTVQSFQSL
jgi:threonine/homoserine/homoserine lactone efflux protein